MSESWQRHVTELVLIVIPCLLIGWDCYAEASNLSTDARATISEVTIHFLYQHPVLALYLGMLFGHLTFPSIAVRPYWVSMLIVASLIGIGVAVDRFRIVPAIMPVIPLVMGIPLGHVAWPQKVATATGESLIVQQGSVTLESRTMVQHFRQ